MWLKSAYARRDDPLALMDLGVEWQDVLRYLLRRLTKPKNADAGQYYYGISRYQAHPLHRKFWDAVQGLTSKFSVITLNYDILAERALHEPSEGTKTKPLFYYGQIPYDQVVRKMVNVAAPPDKKHVLVPLGHSVPIYKLHGSVNWAWEPCPIALKVHDDARSPFRSDGLGRPAVIPPVRIWDEAEQALAAADRWIVCGYSLPPYDAAVRDLIRRSAALGPLKTVHLIDPFSDQLRQRWEDSNAKVKTYVSLETAISQLQPNR